MIQNNLQEVVMPISFGNNDSISPQELKQLEDGLRVLVKIVVRVCKDETHTVGGSPGPLQANLDVPELLSTLNGKFTLSVSEVAKALGTSKNTVYEAVRQGQIPVVKWGRRIFIPKITLAKMLEEAKPHIG
jgi:excisionase family DNA binding protein